MNRADRYARIVLRLDAMKKHAQEKGDGVQADKVRKIEVDVVKLVNNDDNVSKECD